MDKLLKARKVTICRKLEEKEARLLDKVTKNPMIASIVSIEELLKPIQELKRQFGCISGEEE